MKVGDSFWYWRVWSEKSGIYRQCCLSVIVEIYWGGTVVDSYGYIWYDGESLINNELCYCDALTKERVEYKHVTSGRVLPACSLYRKETK
jgi:hypothetical protein